MKKVIIFFMLALIPFLALASDSHHGAEEGVPRVVLYQFINFFALVGLIFYFTRSKMSQFFRLRSENLMASLKEAKRLKQEAETRLQEYTEKLDQLQRENAQTLQRIKEEGLATRKRMEEEAERSARAMEEEVRKTAMSEIEKAKTTLYEEVLQGSLDGARALLSKSVVENDQRRLQKEFVDKIEVVQ